MASNRMGRINEEIQREMANLLRTVKDPRVSDSMVSVIRVDTASDLSVAKIFVSALNKDTEKELMKGLKSAAGYLRREVSRKVDLRAAPEPLFTLDDSIKRGTDILAVLNTLDIPDDEPESGENGEDDDASDN